MRNIVFTVFKVKILEYIYVGASVNIGNDKVDLCKEKKTIIFGLFRFWLKKFSYDCGNFVNLPRTGFKITGHKFLEFIEFFR